MLLERVGLQRISYNSISEVLLKQFSTGIGNQACLLPTAPGVESPEIFNTLGEVLSE